MRTKFPVFWLSLLMLLSDLSVAAETLRLGTFKNTDSPGLQICEQVLQEAYAKLGFSIEVEHLPAERSLFWANSGRLDGELCRNQKSDDLLLVPTPLYAFRLSAFSIKPLPISSWSDLQPYKVAYERGMRAVHEHTELDLLPVNSIQSGILLLDKQRVDILLDDHDSVLYAVNQMSLAQPLFSQPIVLAAPAYHLLNKKHAALAIQLNRVLQEMEKSGRIRQIKEQVMTRLLPESTQKQPVAPQALESD